MQVIENWADVTGRLIATRPHPQLEGYVSATIEVSDVSSVPGFANLLGECKGQTINVNVPAGVIPQAESLASGTVSWRIRKAGPSSIFAHPDVGAS